MIRHLKEYLRENEDAVGVAGFLIYDGIFDFGETEGGAADHLLCEFEYATRLMHSNKVQEQRRGWHRLQEIAVALSLLTKDEWEDE